MKMFFFLFLKARRTVVSENSISQVLSNFVIGKLVCVLTFRDGLSSYYTYYAPLAVV